MPIDSAEVVRIAALAQLELDPATVERFRGQLQAILDYVAILDTLGVEELPRIAGPGEEHQPCRGDEPVPPLPSERALANAPDSAAGHFRVPRVLGA